ncbi:hypothetical protein H072_8736 [Dactylellina haptotyla CBS 200.50]|uniref:C2H2-type domain-containing protein n=1 Tax=Dactylellina haptotyla (strain CBS 200.50) TaxID=1284197 RepID=S8A461_DACHA|nr:hypothetical protein H072_8736 [Dactylellina haptotyla CBS 200.50]
MYRGDENKLPQDTIFDGINRPQVQYNSLNQMADWILTPSYTNPRAANPWSGLRGIDENIEQSSFNQDTQQWSPQNPDNVAQLDADDSMTSSPFQDLDIYNEEGHVEPMELEDLESPSPYVVLLNGKQTETEEGTAVSTPWIYLWKAENTECSEPCTWAAFEDVRLERTRYVKNPEMQAAKAFYNALQVLLRSLQATEAVLSPDLRMHHERTNCENEMLQSFREYERHTSECTVCFPAFMNVDHKLSLCELGTELAENVFLAIDWYATATFGNYETVTLEVPGHSVRSLLQALAEPEEITSFQSENLYRDSLSMDAPIQTLAVESLGIISSILGLEDDTSVTHSRTPKPKNTNEKMHTRISNLTRRSFFDGPYEVEFLTANPEVIITNLDEYLNIPSRRRLLRSQIGNEGMRAIRRLFNVSLHGYNVLEQAFGGKVDDDYDFYHDFPNHADLLSLGVQTFIELSNEKPAYPTALREVYSILHLCDSINQILPHQRNERKRRTESFKQELRGWKNVIEAGDERSAFELIVEVRWPSPRLPSLNQASNFVEGTTSLEMSKNSSTTEIVSDQGFQYHLNDFDPMSKALLWMQLIAGIVFTTIATYFTLNHRMVNILVLYLTGGDIYTLNSSRTIDNTSTNLPNNRAWISTNSMKFIEKVRRHIIDKLRVPEFSKFSEAVEVAMDSLSCGWISTLKDLETMLLRVAKLTECTKIEFLAFVQKVLDLSITCAANMTRCESHRVAFKKSPIRYTNSYKTSRVEEENESWIADETEIPTILPNVATRVGMKSKSGFKHQPFDVISGPPSPVAASFASSRGLGDRIKADFLEDVSMSTEDRLVSDTTSYFPLENIDHDLSGGTLATFTSVINGPTLDPVLTLENQDNILGLSQTSYPTPTSKSYSQSSNSIYNTHSNFDSFWNLSRPPVVVSTLADHSGYYLAPSSNWHLTEDFLGSTSSPSNAYYPPPSIAATLATSYADSLKPSATVSLPPTTQSMHRANNPYISSTIASPISRYPNGEETPRFLPMAPTPPPPVPPPKPRKRRRSSPVKEEDANGTAVNGAAPPPKRQKKTMFFKCPICRHDIAAPRMNLTRHIRSVHADSRQRRIECEWPGCATTFQAARKDNYRAHLRKHQEKLGDPGN